MRPGATPRLELDASYAARRPWAPRRADFAVWAAAALTLAAAPGSVVLAVHVVGEARSRSLNEHYRRKPKPTNVLSFAGPGIGADGRNYIGELVICAPLVAREAHRARIGLRAHWAHLTVHGVLHLRGFDHERAADARKMIAKEIQILDRLGFSSPYA